MKEPHKAGAGRGNGKIAINLAQPDNHMFPKNISPLNSLSPKTLAAPPLQLKMHCVCINKSTLYLITEVHSEILYYKSCTVLSCM